MDIHTLLVMQSGDHIQADGCLSIEAAIAILEKLKADRGDPAEGECSGDG